MNQTRSNPSLPETSSPQSVPALELIQAIFPNKLRLSVSSVASLLDCADQTVRNGICKNTWPIRSVKEGGKRYFDVRDVATFLDRQHELAHAQSRRRPGRPSKRELIERAVSVREVAHD